MKHAYLIMAHNNFYILEKLLKLLDYKNNDIFIHVDKKVKNFPYEKFNNILKHSDLYYVKRIRVNWGGFSQIKCELNLLQEAIKNKYDYYHLLSGVDLPLKGQKYIQKFFEENNGKEFVHFSGKDIENNYIKRITTYYFLQEFMRRENNLYLLQKSKNLLDKIQKRLKINRLNKYKKEVKQGANWFSITHNCAKYVLDNKKEIYGHYKYSYCADELFLQTLIYNSKFRNNLYYNKLDDNYIAILRCIDWNRGEPYTFRSNDFDDLINSKFLFARKFDVNIDKDIVDKIYKKVIEEVS